MQRLKDEDAARKSRRAARRTATAGGEPAPAPAEPAAGPAPVEPAFPTPVPAPAPAEQFYLTPPSSGRELSPHSASPEEQEQQQPGPVSEVPDVVEDGDFSFDFSFDLDFDFDQFLEVPGYAFSEPEEAVAAAAEAAAEAVASVAAGPEPSFPPPEALAEHGSVTEDPYSNYLYEDDSLFMPAPEPASYTQPLFVLPERTLLPPHQPAERDSPLGGPMFTDDLDLPMPDPAEDGPVAGPSIEDRVINDLGGYLKSLENDADQD
ncbi:hypothetical protein LMH87_007161 [Akanthomyces muscarius]|uniref:Uncharacterized protein n=1 Tax=Akanthomyces muscarius TaxID=2231603 RepID=A0A9W8QRP8_AKAMU|nr:hypothetical protein LMH87_007161 [Akanthomyces muscarius]KAJ4165531.1 hypothetical protein LMH87_007161 [Akanthomyces muscarius]